MKRNILIIGLVAVLVAGGAALYFFVIGNGQLEWSGRSASAPGQTGLMAFNPDDLNEIVPRSTDIFVGQVVEKLSTVEKPTGMFRTNFSVEVIKVLKGDAEGVVIVTQNGGLLDGKWVIEDSGYSGRGNADDTQKLEEYLLKSGETRLFITSWWPEFDSYAMSYSPIGRPILGFEEDTSVETIRELVMEHPKVQEVLAVIEKGPVLKQPNEIGESPISPASEDGGTESLTEPQGTDDGGTWQDASVPDTENAAGGASGE